MNECFEENINAESHNLEFVCNHLKVMKELLNKSTYSDLEIIIDYKIFKVHKVILSRNPIFHKMFTSAADLKEIILSDQISDSIESDIKYLFGNCDVDGEEREKVLKFSSAACETFLRYLYANKIEKEDINLDLILVAQKFSDEKLKDFCEAHLVNNVNMRYLTRILLVSLETGCERLKNEACEIVARNFCEMKFNEDFKLVLDNEKALSAILDVFGKCNVTLLTEWKGEDEELENNIKFLRNADLLLTVGNHHFLAHKNILSERNPVFKEIIDAASSNDFPTSINIPDVDFQTFNVFLHYIYIDIVDTHDISKNLLELAQKYNHDKLKDICEEKFLKIFNRENAIDSLITAIKYKCYKLKSNALNFVVVRYDQIKKHDDYQKLLQNPDAANAIIENLSSRLQETETSKDFFNGRFSFNLPTTSSPANSTEFKLKNNRWYIKIRKSSDENFLRVCLCRFDTGSEVCVYHSSKLISAIDEQHNITKSSFHKFKQDDFEWSNSISWSKLKDPKYGFIQDEKITLEVDVTVV